MAFKTSLDLAGTSDPHQPGLQTKYGVQIQRSIDHASRASVKLKDLFVDHESRLG